MARPNRFGMAKLSEQDVVKILREPKSYGCNIRLAKRFNVSVSTIERIRCGIRWAHVTLSDETND